jgi:hypothetical protein
MLLKPSPSAQPGSRSMVSNSKVSACHISSWLIAVLHEKLQPTSQGCSRAEPSTFAIGQGPNSVGTAAWKAEVKIDTATSATASKLVTKRLRESTENTLVVIGFFCFTPLPVVSG